MAEGRIIMNVYWLEKKASFAEINLISVPVLS